MKDINGLIEKIAGRTCCLVASGASLYELEQNIELYRDLNICWVGLGQFDVPERNILKKINKTFDIVFDTASVPESRIEVYERWRMERIAIYLRASDEHVWITSDGLHRDVILRLNMSPLWTKFNNQILLVDNLFPKSSISQYMEVPNSLTLACGALIAGRAKNIVLFGCDGYSGDLSKGADSYYHPEEVKKERMLALGSEEDPGINRDTDLFPQKFLILMSRYFLLFKHFPEIYNCSSITMYNHIQKIKHEQVKELV